MIGGDRPCRRKITRAYLNHKIFSYKGGGGVITPTPPPPLYPPLSCHILFEGKFHLSAFYDYTFEERAI